MLKGKIFIWASSQNFSCDEAKMNTVQEPEILIVFRTIVLNKIIWSIYCIKAPESICAKILCLKRQHVFKVQNNGEYFKNILVVKMRTQNCPFAGSTQQYSWRINHSWTLEIQKLWLHCECRKWLPGAYGTSCTQSRLYMKGFWGPGRILSFFPCTSFLFVRAQHWREIAYNAGKGQSCSWSTNT